MGTLLVLVTVGALVAVAVAYRREAQRQEHERQRLALLAEERRERILMADRNVYRLRVILRAFQGEERIHSAVLAERLASANPVDYRHLDARAMRSFVEPLGLEPRNLQVGGRVAKGLKRCDVEAALQAAEERALAPVAL